MRDRQLGYVKRLDADHWPRIRELAKLGFTQTQIGRAIGICQSLVSAIMALHRPPRPYRPAEARQCAHCGKAVRVAAGRRGAHNTFCSKDCYWAHLRNQAYVRSVYGTRLARRLVWQYFNLRPENVIHHVDANENNNNINNLWVFESQGDHTRFHRGLPVQPIWRGDKVN